MTHEPPPARPWYLHDVGDGLRRYAWTILGDRHRAEDVVQDALLVAALAPARASASRAWFCGVVRNLSFLDRRRERRRRRRELAHRTAARSDDPARRLEKMEAGARLWARVWELPAPFRTTLVLRFLCGLSMDEIALRCAVRPATVRTRLKRGLDRVRVSLLRDGGWS